MKPVLRAAVLGHPIGHTMSPFLHQRLFALQGAALEYSVLDLPELGEAQRPLLAGLDCFNITIPHKANVIPLLDEITPKARACGSVNTVRVREGVFSGTTTDGEGCRRALERHGLALSGKLLLLGNGGAARAIAFEAAEVEGTDLTIACRESGRPRAQALAQELRAFSPASRVRVVSYEELEQAREPYDLLLNTTPVGMSPKAGISPVSGEAVARGGAVFDAVYNPEETELLKLAAKAGVPGVGGLEMLVYQAVAAHAFWFGWSFREEDLDRLIRDAREELEKRAAL